MKTYRNREVVAAYQVEEPGENVHTRNGVQWAPSSSWAVYGILGVEIMSDSAFTAWYAEESDTTEAGFSPIGKTVESVLEYLDLNPDEVERVKEIESGTANPRKGIMSY